MPFTFSHPAAVLPFGYLPKRWVSLTALVAGSMTPDFEYFIRMKMASTYSHTWPGLFWYDLPLGLALLIVYNSIVKNKLIDHLPNFLNKRFSPLKNPSRTYLGSSVIIAIVCILIGPASHLLWDSFTHPNGYFVLHSHKLRHNVSFLHLRFPFYNVLQHLSSLAGALCIVYAIYRLPAGNLTNVNRRGIMLCWIKIAGLAVLILSIRAFTGLSLKQYGDVIISAIAAFLLAIVAIPAITRPRVY